MRAAGLAMVLATFLPLQDEPEKMRAMCRALGAEEIGAREEAAARLRAFVLAGGLERRAAFRKLLAPELGEETLKLAREVYEKLPSLDLIVTAEGRAVVGRPVSFKAALRNLRDEEVVAVGVLSGSHSGKRYPGYKVEITHADGKPVVMPVELDCIPGSNPLVAKDLVALGSGKSFDPLGGHGHWTLQNWIPARAGSYAVRMTADFTSRNAGEWLGGRTAKPVKEELAELDKALARIPAERFEAVAKVTVVFDEWSGLVDPAAATRLGGKETGGFSTGLIRDAPAWTAFAKAADAAAIEDPGIDWTKKAMLVVIRKGESVPCMGTATFADGVLALNPVGPWSYGGRVPLFVRAVELDGPASIRITLAEGRGAIEVGTVAVKKP